MWSQWLRLQESVVRKPSNRAAHQCTHFTDGGSHVATQCGAHSSSLVATEFFPNVPPDDGKAHIATQYRTNITSKSRSNCASHGPAQCGTDVKTESRSNFASHVAAKFGEAFKAPEPFADFSSVSEPFQGSIDKTHAGPDQPPNVSTYVTYQTLFASDYYKRSL
jgi:hypothetical protein